MSHLSKPWNLRLLLQHLLFGKWCRYKKFSYKSNHILGCFEKRHFLNKNFRGHFLGNFWKMTIFIPKSGHTAECRFNSFFYLLEAVHLLNHHIGKLSSFLDLPNVFAHHNDSLGIYLEVYSRGSLLLLGLPTLSGSSTWIRILQIMELFR